MKMIHGGSLMLRDIVAKRNIRSIIVQLADTNAAAVFAHIDTLQCIDAFKRHGFRLGLISSELRSSIIASKFDAMQDTQTDPLSTYQEIAKRLRVPLPRSILVTDNASLKNHGISQPYFHEMATVVLPFSIEKEATSSSFPELTKELLGFPNCLDPAGRSFGPHRILMSQVFYESDLSQALVNLKPIVPGHVLIVPRRRVERFEQLDGDEVSDLWCTAQIVGKTLEPHYNAQSLTFAIQDGHAAGQTVKHVHIHVLPRIAHDFAENDQVYTEIEKHESALHVDNEQRAARSEHEMALEATRLRELFAIQSASSVT